jgi:hypothetical protein
MNRKPNLKSLKPGKGYQSANGEDRIRLNDQRCADEYDILFFLNTLQDEAQTTETPGEPGPARAAIAGRRSRNVH